MVKKSDKEAEKTESFEVMLDRLRGIVKGLESGDVPLEESLQRFSEGVNLAKHCQDRLTKAEAQIEVLMKSSADGIETKPFQSEN